MKLNFNRGSPRWIDASEIQIRDEQLKRAALNGGFRFKVKPLSSVEQARAVGHGLKLCEPEPSSAEMAMAFAVERFVNAVEEWEGFDGDDDKPLPCTPENRRAFAMTFMDEVMQVATKITETQAAASAAMKDELGNSERSGPSAQTGHSKRAAKRA